MDIVVEEKKQKAKYRSALRSRKLIREAYVKLMQEKDADKISVSDIVKTADLNRGTFYAHYSKPDDIKLEISNDIVEEINKILEGFNFADFFKAPRTFLDRIDDLLIGNLSYYKEIMCYTITLDFIEKIKKLLISRISADTSISEKMRQSPQFVIAMELFVGGLITLYTSYIKGDIDVPKGKISQTLTPILMGGSRSFFRSV